MKRPEENSSKKVKALGVKLDKRLASYVAAAGAAGVGMLAWAQPADAEIVYTPANTPIAVNGGPVVLDLNNDGTPDFTLSNYSYFSHGDGDAFLKVSPAQPGNAMWVIPNKKRMVAAPVFWGVVVGAERKFQAASAFLDLCGLNAQSSSGNTSFGLWGKGDRFTGPYLGLKFTVGSEVHYGWARITVVAHGIDITATLNGYAYETVPNRPIVTGMTHGTLDTAAMKAAPSALPAPQLEPVSLGRLALGASGRSIRKQ